MPRSTFATIHRYISTHTIDSSYISIEQRIQAACEAYKARTNVKITPLARVFDVPISRLRARLQGRQPRTQRTITTKRLHEAQEAALIR
jgi:hypothetical protein